MMSIYSRFNRSISIWLIFVWFCYAICCFLLSQVNSAHLDEGNAKVAIKIMEKKIIHYQDVRRTRCSSESQINPSVATGKHESNGRHPSELSPKSVCSRQRSNSGSSGKGSEATGEPNVSRAALVHYYETDCWLRMLDCRHLRILAAFAH